MTRLPDLVRDSKLETDFSSDCNFETIHTYHESDPISRRRAVLRSEHWKRQRRIGGGGYSTVWLEQCAYGSRHGVQVRAVKQIETGGRFQRVDVNRELVAIAKFSHSRYERCFVQSYGWYRNAEHLWIAMEYLELGDLLDYLEDRPPIPESEAQEITFQILEGLKMMHENEFTHRDLKPRNILIKSQPPEEWWVKIADFGISKRIEESQETSTTLRGTTGFIAPELYGFGDLGSPFATDIWSLGEITFQMLTKMPAFKPIARLSSYTSKPEKFPATTLSDAGVSKLGIEFIRSLMRPDPDSRLTAEMAILHPWIKPLSQIPTLSRAEALFQPTTPEGPARMSPESPAIPGSCDDNSTIMPSERSKVKNTRQEDSEQEDNVDGRTSWDMEERYEDDLTRSQSSMGREQRAPSLSSDSCKDSCSDATSISQRTPGIEQKYSEEWWEDHLRQAGLISKSPQQEKIGSSPKKPGSGFYGILAKPIGRLTEKQQRTSGMASPVYPDLDDVLETTESQQRSPEIVPLWPASRSNVAREQTEPRKKERKPNSTVSSIVGSDVRYLANSLMPSLSSDENLQNATGQRGPSTLQRPPLAQSHSADNADLRSWILPPDPGSQSPSFDPRLNLETRLRSKTYSGPSRLDLVTNRHLLQVETMDESRDPSRGIVALPLIQQAGDQHSKYAKGFRRVYTGTGTVVEKITAGFRLKNEGLSRGTTVDQHSGSLALRFTLPVEEKRNRKISFCPHNKFLVTSSGEPIGVEFWSLVTGRQIFAQKIFHSNSCIAVSPNENLFASTSAESLTLWNNQGGSIATSTISSAENLSKPRFSHDGNILGAISNHGKVHLWKVYIGNSTLHLRKLKSVCFDDNVLALGFQENNTRMVVALDNTVKVMAISNSPGPESNLVQTYQFDVSVLGRSFRPRKSSRERGLATAISANGRMAAQAEPDGLIGSILFIQNIAYRTDDKGFKIMISPVVQTMSFSPDGEILAISTKARDVILYDAHQGKRIQRIEDCHKTLVTGMFLAAKGEFLATCSSSEGIKFWSTDGCMERFAKRDETCLATSGGQ